MLKVWDCWLSCARILRLTDFNVCLKGSQDPRYFTTQADATHFSGWEDYIV